MAELPLDHEEGVKIDDPELLAELDASMEEAERGEGEPWEVVRQQIFGTYWLINRALAHPFTAHGVAVRESFV
jgi:hypothetical protein